MDDPEVRVSTASTNSIARLACALLFSSFDFFSPSSSARTVQGKRKETEGDKAGDRSTIPAAVDLKASRDSGSTRTFVSTMT